MKKLLLILLCLPMIFHSCSDNRDKSAVKKKQKTVNEDAIPTMLNSEFMTDNTNPIKYLESIVECASLQDKDNPLSYLNFVAEIHRKGEAYYRRMSFMDGSESNMKLNKISDTRYNVIGKSDYLIINSDGNVEFWDKDGYLLTCSNTKQ